MKMLFMYFDIGFYGHSAYILWLILVIFLFMSVQCIFTTNTCIYYKYNTYKYIYYKYKYSCERISEPLQSNTEWISQLNEILNRFTRYLTENSSTENATQLWETIVILTFIGRLGRAATAPPSYRSWALRSSRWLPANLLKSLWAPKLTHFLQLYEQSLPPNRISLGHQGCNDFSAASLQTDQGLSQDVSTAWSEIDGHKEKHSHSKNLALKSA